MYRRARIILVFFGVLTFMGLMTYYRPPEVGAEEQAASWLDTTAQPSLEESWLMTADQFRNAIRQGYNPSCSYATIMTREYDRGLGIFRQTKNGCWHHTSIGKILKNSNYLSASVFKPMAGPVTNIGDNGSGAYLIPTPRSEILLERASFEDSSKSYLKFYFKPTVDSKFEITRASHTISAEETLILKHRSGSNLYPETTSKNFSRSGRYFVASTDAGLFRVDLETKMYLNFGEPIKRSSGWNPFMKVSITNDGRYAVASGTANSGNQWMRIYDLGSCLESQTTDGLSPTPAACDYRDITDYVRQNIPNFNRFTMAEFIDEDNIIFYHYNDAKDKTYTRYMLRAPHAGPRNRDYIALGDSFASGEGAYDYFGGTNEGKNLNNCHLSRKSYPYLIGSWLRLNDYHSVACSGATTRNIVGPELIDTSLTNPWRSNQYKKEVPVNELNEWLPGFYLQKTFLDERSPDVTTISILGNDLGFSDKIKRCLGMDTCYDTYEDRLELLREVRGKFDKMVEVYEQLKQSSPATKIYAIGYPEVGNPHGEKCALNIRLNRDELEFAQQYVRQINQVIELAAKRSGVVYVDISKALSGYQYCEGDGKEVALNGLTMGNDIAMVIGNESYHPNAKGHELIAREIVQQTNDFNTPMPAPDPSIQAPANEDDLSFLDKPKTLRNTYRTDYEPGLTGDVVYKGLPIGVKRGSAEKPFKPGSPVLFILFSEPAELGTFNADSFGNIEATIEIPNTVPTGFHTIHARGVDYDGKPLDIYRVVYVAHSKTDKNGDGIDDTEQPCGVFEASGIDEDSDGIDDVCDDTIKESEGEEDPSGDGTSDNDDGSGDSGDTDENTDNNPAAPTTNLLEQVIAAVVQVIKILLVIVFRLFKFW